MTKIRSFIAVELPADVRDVLGKLIEQIRTPQTRFVRWVSPENIHLSLKFLGEIPSQKVEELSEIMVSEIGNFKAFKVCFGGVGAFPNMRQPRVIWVGIQAPQNLFDMQKAVEDVTCRIGLSPQYKPFSPHLTLGRVGDAPRDNIQAVASVISNIKNDAITTFTVDKVSLFRSDLKPSGAIYTHLRQIDLK